MTFNEALLSTLYVILSIVLVCVSLLGSLVLGLWIFRRPLTRWMEAATEEAKQDTERLKRQNEDLKREMEDLNT